MSLTLKLCKRWPYDLKSSNDPHPFSPRVKNDTSVAMPPKTRRGEEEEKQRKYATTVWNLKRTGPTEKERLRHPATQEAEEHLIFVEGGAGAVQH